MKAPTFGIILFLIIIIPFFVGYYISSFGYLQIIYTNKTININNNINEELNSIWKEFKKEKRENGFCLEVKNNTITNINSKRHKGTERSVIIPICNIMSIHTHSQSCSLSPADVIRFYIYNETYMSIICGINKIAVYDKYDMQKSYEVNIIK